MIKVTIDPGHNEKSNVSPTVRGYIEGVQMYKLAGFLAAELNARGITTEVTRKKITDDPAIADRGKLAAKNGSAMFISLHSNAPCADKNGKFDGTITGSCIYYSMTDAANKAFADKLGAAVAKCMGHKYRGSLTRRYSAQHPDRDYYGVIRNAAQNGCRAAFLVEHGFHTNSKDAAFLMSDKNLRALAAAEAEVVAEHFGVKPANKVMYTVQCGAFADKSNAEMYAEKIRRAGFAAMVVKIGKLYRVQTGAFAARGNADNYVKALKKSGFSTVIVVAK